MFYFASVLGVAWLIALDCILILFICRIALPSSSSWRRATNTRDRRDSRQTMKRQTQL